jgi:Icc-related predicted phosphoesterase
MKILVFSDAHGNAAALDGLVEEASSADLVLFGGDFAAVGAPETGLPVLERLLSLNDRVFAVLGNCDDPSFREELEARDASVESSLSYFSGLILTGSGGGSRFTGDTPNERSDEDLVADLRLVEEGSAGEDGTVTGWENLVVIAHNPPKDTNLDRIVSGAHVGSQLIRAFVERYRPLLVVSGHIHESFGVDEIGPSRLVNPGSIAEGRYAVVTLSGGGSEPFRVDGIELKRLS